MCIRDRAFIIFLIYVISLSLGPRKLRIETDNIQIAEVKDDKFMEYVDVEGLVQPILTIKVNTREAGSVDRIVGEEGNMMKQGDTLLILTNPDLIRSIEDLSLIHIYLLPANCCQQYSIMFHNIDIALHSRTTEYGIQQQHYLFLVPIVVLYEFCAG